MPKLPDMVYLIVLIAAVFTLTRLPIDWQDLNVIVQFLAGLGIGVVSTLAAWIAGRATERVVARSNR